MEGLGWSAFGSSLSNDVSNLKGNRNHVPKLSSLCNQPETYPDLAGQEPCSSAGIHPPPVVRERNPVPMILFADSLFFHQSCNRNTDPESVIWLNPFIKVFFFGSVPYCFNQGYLLRWTWFHLYSRFTTTVIFLFWFYFSTRFFN